MRPRSIRRSSLHLMPSPDTVERRDNENELEDDDDDDDDDNEFPGLGKGRGKGKGNSNRILPSSSTSETFAPSPTSSLPQTMETTVLSTSPTLPQPTLPQSSSVSISETSSTLPQPTFLPSTSVSISEIASSTELSSVIPSPSSTSETNTVSLTSDTSSAPSTLETSTVTTETNIIATETDITTAEADIVVTLTSVITTQTRVSTTQTDTSGPSISTSREPSYATTSGAPTQAVDGNGGLSQKQIAGIVIGPIAFLLLMAAAIFMFRRRRRKNPSQIPGLKSLFNKSVANPNPDNHSPNHARQTEESFIDQEANLPNTAPNTAQKPRPTTAAAAFLTTWLTQLRHSHYSSRSTHHPQTNKHPHDTPAASDSGISSSASSILSLPATFVTRHTNSTFLPTTALHHPRCHDPVPVPEPDPALLPPASNQQQQQQQQQPIGNAQGGDGKRPASTLMVPGSTIPSEVRLSGLGGGEREGERGGGG